MRIATVLAIVLASSLGSVKAQKVEARPPGLLTRAELRDCMVLEQRLKTEVPELQRQQAQLAADRQAADRLRAELEAAFAGLDRGDQAAVDQYNAKVQQQAGLAVRYNGTADALNARSDGLKALAATAEKNCANRKFDPADEAAIKSGR